jgi:hypothetical protein
MGWFAEARRGFRSKEPGWWSIHPNEGGPETKQEGCAPGLVMRENCGWGKTTLLRYRFADESRWVVRWALHVRC